MSRPTAEERVRALRFDLNSPVSSTHTIMPRWVVAERNAIHIAEEHAQAEVEAALIERTAQLTAHRGCCGTEHDPANGKIHGYCVVCGVPWPCAYAGTPLTEVEAATAELRAERERDEARAQLQPFDGPGTYRTIPMTVDGVGCALVVRRGETALGAAMARAVKAEAEVERLLRSRDEAYTERNALVAALSKVFPASLEQHDPADTSWDLERRVTRLRAQLRAALDTAELAERRLHTVLEEHSLARCEACASVVLEDEIRTVGDDAVPLCAACYEEEITL